jgi:hypothetical protein
MIKRKVLFEYRITCYDERDVKKPNCPGTLTNWPTPFIDDAPWYEVPVEESKEEFDTALNIWADRMQDNFDLLIQDQGEKDCQDIIEYLWLCEYETRVVNVEEEVTEEEKVVVIPPTPPVAPPVKFTTVEIARAKTMIKNLEETAARLPFAREDLIKRANELRTKYGLIGEKI